MTNAHPFSDIAWDIPEPLYRQDPALSFSSISRYEREGWRAVPHLDEKISTPSLTFGSVVDALVTGGYGEFDTLFKVADLPELSENLENITKTLFAAFGGTHLFRDIPDNELARIGKECNFYAADRYREHRIRQIKENCGEYYDILATSTDRQLISQKDYNDALLCAERFRNSPMTCWYFSESPQEGIENYNQLKFRGIDRKTGIAYRAMADLIKVNHPAKTVIPCDVKTTGKPEEKFYESFLQFNYNLQARNYWRLIRMAMDEDPYYRDFKLANFKFLVINRTTLSPLVWEDSKTQVYGDVVYHTQTGRTIIIRDPYKIGAELMRYKTEEHQYPLEVSPVNSITEFIEKS